MAIAAVPVPRIMSFPSITSISKARQHVEETRRKPDLGAERRREAAVQDCLANYERWKAEEAAEKESWDPLFLEDRMKENTQRLMQELEQEQVHALLLDCTKFTNHIRAACRARPCYEEEAGTTRSRTINDPYRNFAVQNDWRKSRHYYHVCNACTKWSILSAYPLHILYIR